MHLTCTEPLMFDAFQHYTLSAPGAVHLLQGLLTSQGHTCGVSSHLCILCRQQGGTSTPHDVQVCGKALGDAPGGPAAGGCLLHGCVVRSHHWPRPQARRLTLQPGTPTPPPSAMCIFLASGCFFTVRPLLLLAASCRLRTESW